MEPLRGRLKSKNPLNSALYKETDPFAHTSDVGHWFGIAMKRNHHDKRKVWYAIPTAEVRCHLALEVASEFEYSPCAEPHIVQS